MIDNASKRFVQPIVILDLQYTIRNMWSQE